jgi:hypothetical protein
MHINKDVEWSAGTKTVNRKLHTYVRMYICNHPKMYGNTMLPPHRQINYLSKYLSTFVLEISMVPQNVWPQYEWPSPSASRFIILAYVN